MNNQIINHTGSHLEKPKELEEDSTSTSHCLGFALNNLEKQQPVAKCMRSNDQSIRKPDLEKPKGSKKIPPG